MVHPDVESGARTARRPFKIHFEYFLANSTTQEDQDYLMTQLLPTTAAVLKQYVQVGTICQHVCAHVWHVTTASEAVIKQCRSNGRFLVASCASRHHARVGKSAPTESARQSVNIGKVCNAAVSRSPMNTWMS